MAASSTMNDDSDEIKTTMLNLKVGDSLYRKIEKHLQIIKHREFESKTKQKWLVEAIKEKIKNELEADEVPKDRRLIVKMDARLSKKLEDRVRFHKKFRTSYSKKLWVIEAIQEKLEREEKEAKKVIRDFMNETHT